MQAPAAHRYRGSGVRSKRSRENFEQVERQEGRVARDRENSIEIVRCRQLQSGGYPRERAGALLVYQHRNAARTQLARLANRDCDRIGPKPCPLQRMLDKWAPGEKLQRFAPADPAPRSAREDYDSAFHPTADVSAGCFQRRSDAAEAPLPFLPCA